jgi:hypothetical protein
VQWVQLAPRVQPRQQLPLALARSGRPESGSSLQAAAVQLAPAALPQRLQSHSETVKR